jgi:hypothetical protein
MTCSSVRALSVELASPSVGRYTASVFAVVRFLLSGLGAALVLGSAGCSRQPTCAMTEEPARVLDLNLEPDRAHLQSDLATVDRLSRAYGRWAVEHPPSDTRFISLQRLEQHARAYCQALLAERISATHGIDVPRLERAIADQQAQLSQR